MKKMTIPAFETESEEAKWWDRHMGAVESRLKEGMKKRTLKKGGPRRVILERRQSKNITIRFALAEIERARAVANKKGIGYQTLMKMLVKEGLDRESEGRTNRRRKRAS
jgi:predicted DNA binding CopG/RHH family protein